MREQTPDSPWLRVAVFTVVLSVGALVPVPVERRREWDGLGPDTVVHFLGHAAYAAVLADALAGGRSTAGETAVLAALVSTAHSLVTGNLQRRVPGRAFEPTDLGAAVAGAVAAAAVWYLGSARPAPRGIA